MDLNRSSKLSVDKYLYNVMHVIDVVYVEQSLVSYGEIWKFDMHATYRLNCCRLHLRDEIYKRCLYMFIHEVGLSLLRKFEFLSRALLGYLSTEVD